MGRDQTLGSPFKVAMTTKSFTGDPQMTFEKILIKGFLLGIHCKINRLKLLSILFLLKRYNLKNFILVKLLLYKYLFIQFRLNLFKTITFRFYIKA